MFLVGLAAGGSAQAGPGRHAAALAPRACLVEVLWSEVVPVGPLFHHTFEETLRITPPNGSPVTRTVEQVIPWQAPPPRQGQRMMMACDSALIRASFGLP